MKALPPKTCRKRAALLALALALPLAAHAAPPREAARVQLADMTWLEVKERLMRGPAIAIVPTGGTEQNGPHLALGKHNRIMEHTAAETARRLENAVVTPVIAYVPEGRISPPEGHMRFPGTLSLSETTFAALLEDTARSLKQHGFRMICFMGDHGGSQAVQARVAEKLSAEWKAEGVSVLHLSDYYESNGQKKWIEARGIKVQKPEAHAGFFDTSELLLAHPASVRKAEITAFTEDHYPTTGAAGDPTAATADYGRKLLALKIEAAVAQIQHARSVQP